MTLKLNETYLDKFVRSHEIDQMRPGVAACHETIVKGTGAGSDFLGWRTWPEDYDKDEFSRIKKAAKKIQDSCDVLVVIGIGGSYLGARAVIEAIRSPMYNELRSGTPAIVYAGNCISGTAVEEILSYIEGKDVCLNVISKSGTTTEPAVAFRIFRTWMTEKYGEAEARKRIFVTTDKSRGALKHFSDESGYETFVVPDNVGGRFSVLTAVGLLPIAVAGIDIDAMMGGARDAMRDYATPDLSRNDAYRYAVIRNILNRKGKDTEIMVSYEPRTAMFNEWWKQLYGESEGKDGKGIFPASVIFSTDLHSMGQFIQDGNRNLFETVLSIRNMPNRCVIPTDPHNVDGLSFLDGKKLDDVKKTAMQGTLLAHEDGGVPGILLELDGCTPHDIGYLIYFFELAVAMSGYLSGVNPFDQPGVEAYKKNMYALLGKPGYEEEKAKLEKRIGARS